MKRINVRKKEKKGRERENEKEIERERKRQAGRQAASHNCLVMTETSYDKVSL